jgi:hypothetical protein
MAALFVFCQPRQTDFWLPCVFLSWFLPTLVCTLHQFVLDSSKLGKIRGKFVVSEIKYCQRVFAKKID